MTATTIRTAPPVEVPQDHNGFCAVARAPLHLRADEVKVGDIVLDGGYVNAVTAVQTVMLLGHGGSAVFLAGGLNRVRFPHEEVTVIRPAKAVTSPAT